MAGREYRIITGQLQVGIGNGRTQKVFQKGFGDVTQGTGCPDRRTEGASTQDWGLD